MGGALELGGSRRLGRCDDPGDDVEHTGELRVVLEPVEQLDRVGRTTESTVPVAQPGGDQDGLRDLAAPDD
jgi:hypothetical protein